MSVDRALSLLVNAARVSPLLRDAVQEIETEIEELREDVRKHQAWIHAAVGDWDNADFDGAVDCEWLCQKVCAGPCEGIDVGPRNGSTSEQGT